MPADSSTFMVRYSRGRGKHYGKAENKALPLNVFKEQFRKPVTTGERLRDYLKLPEEDQKHLKSVAGWFFRTQVEGGKRNRGSGRPSDMITLDFDYATPEFFQSIIDKARCSEWCWFIHTSRRHTPEKPRFRLFIFLAAPLPNDFYGPASRIVASYFDPEMQFVDKVSFRPAQMMFMPTASRDSEFVFVDNTDGALVDWQDLLETFELAVGDWRDIGNLPKIAGEELRNVAEKAENPEEKQGPVGNWCRAYNVPDAIEAFLSDIYEPVDGSWSKPRYTYLGGTTTNGAEVQDDGLFLYSHHGSDPVSDQLVNSFDLVRIHKFGHLDHEKGVDLTDKPITQYPSYKAMLDWMKDDGNYRSEVVKSQYDMAAMAADFTDDMVAVGHVDPNDEGTTEEVILSPEEWQEINDLVGVDHVGRDFDQLPTMRLKKKAKPAPKKDFIQDLELTQQGLIVSNAPNIAQILSNDLRIRDAIEYNEFTQRVVTRHSIQTKLYYVTSFRVIDAVNGDIFEDHHAASLRMLLESPNGPGKPGYNLRTVSQRDLDDAIIVHARANAFHPIVEYLTALQHDGEARAESLWIKYCGCPDTPYFRETARKWLTAAVARVFEPGLKFDFVPIIAGPQGRRKSSLFMVLGKSWFGEMKANFKDENKLIEAMQGNWIMEIPELSSLTKSGVEDAKAFISAQSNDSRLAYAHYAKAFRRQCVFAGTTNDDEYLLDRTGNRRWWPIPLAEDHVIDTSELARNVDQIWAEAVQFYLALRAEIPHGDLPLHLTHPESIRTSIQLQLRAQVQTEVDSYADLLRPWLDQMVLPEGADDFDAAKKTTLREHRRFVTIAQAWTEGLENNSKLTQTDSRAIGHALRENGWNIGNVSRRVDGKVTKVFYPGPDVLKRWRDEDDGLGMV